MRATILLSSALLWGLFALPAAAQETGDDSAGNCGYLCAEDGTPLSTALETPPDIGLVRRIFEGMFAEACSWGIEPGPEYYGPDVYEMTFRPDYASAEEADRPLRLYRFFCGAGAYNQRHVYLTWTNDYGVRAVAFPVPIVDIRYQNDEMDAALDSMTLTGLGARHELVNSSFDEATRTIREWSCWRGLCDASGYGEWVLEDDTFRLVAYDIDPTYDGELNLFRVADFTTPRPVDTTTPIPFEPPVLDEEE